MWVLGLIEGTIEEEGGNEFVCICTQHGFYTGIDVDFEVVRPQMAV